MNPWKQEVWQGGGQRKRSFEGWYFKQVGGGGNETWSIIPGLARGANGEGGRSFVQVIEGRTARSWWFEYPREAFEASRSELDIRVGGSRFSSRGISLDLGEGQFSGRIDFGPLSPPRSAFLWPGVMGPFSFAPFMECRHALVSLDHELSGGLRVEGREIDLGGGRGYVEKDWGVSMPSRWIWSQSNNFPTRGDSLMFSLAKIPWLGSSFDGFLCVGRLGGREILETTWTGARLQELLIGEASVEACIASPTRRVSLRMRRARGGILRAPVQGVLSRRIAESVDATLEVSVTEGGRAIFEAVAHNAGLEVVGDWKDGPIVPQKPLHGHS